MGDCSSKQVSPAKQVALSELGSCVRINRVMPNTHRRRDETVELRRVGVGGVNTIRN